METSKDPVVYLTEKEWNEKGMMIMHGQTSFEKNENGIDVFSNHQVKPEKK